MSKSRQQISAAQRRERERQQRQERLNTGQKKQRGSRRRNAKNNPWPLIAVILVIVAIAVGIFLYMANQPAPQKAGGGQGAEATTLKTITTLDPTLLANVGTGNAQSAMHALPPGAQVPNGPTGKPQFLYVGADYCPYCAAQRWSIIIALSRFGTFGPLDALTSSEDNIPTYSFHQAKYTSQYIDFVPLETTDNQGNKLDVPDATQTQLITTYNAPPYTDSKGSIPFILIGNKQTSTGAFYSPTVIQTLSYDEIGKQVTDPS